MAIITISRGTYSGGRKLAEKVAERLGYKCVSQEFLAEAAEHYKVAKNELQHALNEKPGFFENMTLKRKHFLALIRATLCRLVKDENVVYHGRAGHLLIKGIPHILRTRIIAGMNYRIEILVKERGFAEQEAIRYIEKLDRERVQWSKSLFHVDTRDPSLYDLVVEVDRIGIEGACDILCTAASLERFRKTDESQKRMNDFILSSEVKAAIAAYGLIPDDLIEIKAHDGVIDIFGRANALRDVEKIKEIAGKQTGVNQVLTHLKTLT